MELNRVIYNNIICSDNELEMIRKALDYYTQNVISKKIKENDVYHPDTIKAVKYEELCGALKIEGYEYT